MEEIGRHPVIKNLSIEHLKEKPQSIPRNPLIARIFYIAGYIERYGSGIQRILTSFSDAGLPEPEFQADAWSLTLTLQKDIFTPGYLAQLGLNERQRLALSYVREQGEITNSALQQITSVSRRTAAYDLSHRVKTGILELQGTRKAARYILNPARQQRTPENNSGSRDEKA